MIATITLNRQKLLAVLRDVLPATVSRTTLPILSNVLFEIDNGSLTVHASNLEASVSSTMECDVFDNLKFLVDAKLLNAWLSGQTREDISIVVYPASVVLQAGKSKTKINTLDANEFVNIENITDNYFILGEELQTALSAAVLATATNKNEVRSYLRGVFVSKQEDYIEFIGMNGIFMVSYRMEDYSPITLEAIIPNRSISVLTKLMAGSEQIEITYVPEKVIQFSMHGGSKILRTQLLVGKYPGYKKLLPKNHDAIIVVNREELIRSITMAMLFATSDINRVHFSITQTDLNVTAKSNEQGEYEDTIPSVATFGSLPGEFILNGTYVLSWLRSQNSENVQLERINSETAPIVLRSADEGMSEKSYMLLPPMVLVDR